jgi:hypothetical protein
LTESDKRGDGNCYVYSIGEAMGLFYGQEDKGVSSCLRQKVSEVLKEGSRLGEGNVPEGPYRVMIREKATTPSEVRILQRSEQEWVDHWILKRCGRDYGWADTWLVPLATSSLLGKSILMLFSDSRETGSVSQFTNPDGVVKPVGWEKLCEMFPPGSAARSNLLIIMYNGNLSSTGDHFSGTRSLHGPRRGVGPRLVGGMTYVGWSIRQGATWAVRALEEIIEGAIVYPNRGEDQAEGDSATSDSEWGGGMEADMSRVDTHPPGPADEDFCWSTMGGAGLDRRKAIKKKLALKKAKEEKEKAMLGGNKKRVIHRTYREVPAR